MNRWRLCRRCQVMWCFDATQYLLCDRKCWSCGCFIDNPKVYVSSPVIGSGMEMRFNEVGEGAPV